MRRLAIASAAVLLSGIAAAQAAPPLPPPTGAAANPALLPVQGWWERDNQTDRAREGYWRLPPPARQRYNSLQNDIKRLTQQRQDIDNRIERAEREQRRILGFAGR